jgi:pyruvate/2-oxoglutarate dehydrogenase complex dihydrolipoamide acyltransferase (E2) component
VGDATHRAAARQIASLAQQDLLLLHFTETKYASSTVDRNLHDIHLLFFLPFNDPLKALMTPAVRRLVREHDLSLDKIAGTGKVSRSGIFFWFLLAEEKLRLCQEPHRPFHPHPMSHHARRDGSLRRT